LLHPAADDLEGRYIRNQLLYQYPAAAARRLAKFEIQQGLEQYLPVRAAMETAAQTIDGWAADLTSKQDQVDKLQTLITKQHGELNFVGLSKAFQRLAKAKSEERSLHGLLSIFIAVLMAAVIAGVAYLSRTEYQTHIVISGLSAEVLLAYLLRVSLGSYASAKAQLLQFAHRRELCAFIEGYAEFIMTLRDKAGQESLQKFEAIIFSGVTPNPEKIPSQFDGLEGLAKLVSELNSAVKR
jgi:hypothetical protein